MGGGAYSESLTPGGVVSLATPPTHFHRKAAGAILCARADLTSPQCVSSAPVATPSKHSAAQKLGLRYETRVVQFIEQYYRLIPQCPIHFKFSPAKWRTIIPDILVFSSDCRYLVVCEIKRQHSADAYNQLEFYRPIVEKAFPFCRVATLEICGNFYSVKLPVAENYHVGIDSIFNLSVYQHNVMLLSERELKIGLGGQMDGMGARPP